MESGEQMTLDSAYGKPLTALVRRIIPANELKENWIARFSEVLSLLFFCGSFLVALLAYIDRRNKRK